VAPILDPVDVIADVGEPRDHVRARAADLVVVVEDDLQDVEELAELAGVASFALQGSSTR